MPTGVPTKHWRHALRQTGAFRARAALLGVLLAVLLALPILERAIRWSHGASIGQDVADFRKALADPLHYLLQRSPGARAAFGLLQTKHGTSASLPKHGPRGLRVKPHERVLANVRYGPPDWSPNAFADDLVVNANPLSMPGDFTTPDNAGASGGAAGAGGLPQFGGVPGYVGTAPPVSTAARGVPEPVTWAALIWGMFLVGTALRSWKHRTVARQAVASSKVPKQGASSPQPFAPRASACPELALEGRSDAQGPAISESQRPPQPGATGSDREANRQHPSDS